MLLGTIVTCGASIEGLDDASPHAVVEKERHKFPKVLQKLDTSVKYKLMGKKTSFCLLEEPLGAPVSYLTSKLSLFKESGKVPCSRLFSKSLAKDNKNKTDLFFVYSWLLKARKFVFTPQAHN